MAMFAQQPPLLLHPEMANFYRIQVAELYGALQEEAEAKRLKAGEVLRSPVKEIILAPEDSELRRPGRSRWNPCGFPQKQNPGRKRQGIAI
jgi:hypothetical protein